MKQCCSEGPALPSPAPPRMHRERKACKVILLIIKELQLPPAWVNDKPWHEFNTCKYVIRRTTVMWHGKLGKDNLEVFLHPFDQQLSPYFRIFIWHWFWFFSSPIIFFVLPTTWVFDDILIFMEKTSVTNPGYQLQHIKWAAAVKLRKHLFSLKKCWFENMGEGKRCAVRVCPHAESLLTYIEDRAEWEVFSINVFVSCRKKYFWQIETWLGNGQSYKFPDWKTVGTKFPEHLSLLSFWKINFIISFQLMHFVWKLKIIHMKLDH